MATIHHPNINMVFNEIRDYFHTVGFNLVLAVRRENYDKEVDKKRAVEQIFPEAKSIILVGFAGNGFWDVLKKYRRDKPSFEKQNQHLIDTYTELKFEEVSNILFENDIAFKIAYPFGENAMALDYVKLGEAAGAGVKSLLGILIHPEFGPWLSLRGALLLDHVLETYDGALTYYDPCPSCTKPCITACPAKTISEKGWDWESCMKFRISDETCAGNCASRRACPVGAEHQYSEEQLAYHHEFVIKSVKKYFN